MLRKIPSNSSSIQVENTPIRSISLQIYKRKKMSLEYIKTERKYEGFTR